MIEKITLVIYVEYKQPEVRADIPSASSQLLGLDKFSYKIASLFGKVKNRVRMRIRFRRDIVQEIPDP